MVDIVEAVPDLLEALAAIFSSYAVSLRLSKKDVRSLMLMVISSWMLRPPILTYRASLRSRCLRIRGIPSCRNSG